MRRSLLVSLSHISPQLELVGAEGLIAVLRLALPMRILESANNYLRITSDNPPMLLPNLFAISSILIGYLALAANNVLRVTADMSPVLPLAAITRQLSRVNLLLHSTKRITRLTPSTAQL